MDMKSPLVSQPASFYGQEILIPRRCIRREDEESSFLVRGMEGSPCIPFTLDLLFQSTLFQG